MSSQEFEDLKKELIDRFLGRYDDLIGIILDGPGDTEYHMGALSNYIFHEWTAYTQALNEFDIVSDEEYEELRGVDIDKEYLAANQLLDVMQPDIPSLDLSKFGTN